jgi:hypothetical protein
MTFVVLDMYHNAIKQDGERSSSLRIAMCRRDKLVLSYRLPATGVYEDAETP